MNIMQRAILVACNKIELFKKNRKIEKMKKIQTRLFMLLDYELRYRDDSALMKGFNRSKDLLLRLSCYRILEPEIFSDTPKLKFFKDPSLSNDSEGNYSKIDSDYIANKEEVDRIVERAQVLFKDIVESYFLVKANLAGINTKTQIEKYFLDRARDINKDSRSLSGGGIILLRKETNERISWLKEEISERNSIKIKPSFQDVVYGITIMSSVFFISGYIYVYVLLGNLGVEVSKYFSLGDYLSASIDCIRCSVQSAVFAISGYLFRVYEDFRKTSNYVLHLQTRWREPLFLLLFVAFGLTAVVGWRRSLPNTFFLGLELILVLIIFSFSPWIAKKFSSTSLKPLFFTLFLLFFLCNLLTRTSKEIYYFKNSDISESKKYNFFFNEDLKIDLVEEDLVLVMSNNKYLFFYDPQIRKSVIVPERAIKYIIAR